MNRLDNKTDILHKIGAVAILAGVFTVAGAIIHAKHNPIKVKNGRVVGKLIRCGEPDLLNIDGTNFVLEVKTSKFGKVTEIYTDRSLWESYSIGDDVSIMLYKGLTGIGKFLDKKDLKQTRKEANANIRELQSKIDTAMGDLDIDDIKED